MAYSRKDSKGRALRKGESFRKDKDLYVYKYVDPFGKAKYLYSKDLAKLREKEERLLKDQLDGLDIYAMGKSTVNYVYDRYIKTKTELRKTTRANYDYTYDHYVRDDFGKRRIAEIKYSDVLYFYQYLADEEELSISTIESVHTLLHPTFQLAVRDDIIRKNPSDNVLAEIKKKWGKTIGVRHALTISQQRIFLEVLEQPENLKWKPIIVFLLGTGCRAGEMIAIRWKDLDFNERTISINHAASFLAGHNGAGDGGFIISKPKTEAGIRMIPMLDSVYEVLEEHAAICRAMGKNDLEVDGMSGFVFLNRYGNLLGRSQSTRRSNGCVMTTIFPKRSTPRRNIGK